MSYRMIKQLKKEFKMSIFDFFNKTKRVDIKIDERTIVTIHNKKEAEFYCAGMLKMIVLIL